MANEIDTGGSAAETIAAEVVDRLLIPAAYGSTVILPLVKHHDMTGANSLVSEHVKWPELSGSVSALTDGSDASNSDIDTTSVTATVSAHGIMFTVTDLFTAASVINLADIATQGGLAVGADIDINLAAEFPDLTTAVGATTVNLTNANYLSAIHQMELNALLDRGPIVAVMHPIQIADLRTDLLTETATVASSDVVGGPFSVGERWNLYGTTIYSSIRCPAANTAADRVGAMFGAGPGAPFVYSRMWDPRSEFQRDASMRGFEIVITAAYGDECIDPAGGFEILSDHE